MKKGHLKDEERPRYPLVTLNREKADKLGEVADKRYKVADMFGKVADKRGKPADKRSKAELRLQESIKKM